MESCEESKLEEKVRVIDIIPYRLLSDKKGSYIPYCMEINKAILLNDRNCLELECEHLQRFYPLNKKAKFEGFISHNEIIKKLEKRLSREGVSVFKNQNYILENHKEEMEKLGLSSKDRNGEIDLYAVDSKRKTLIFIEVKTSQCQNNDKKAHKQLRKDLLYLKDEYPEFKFIFMYAYGKHKNRRGYNVENYEIENFR